MCLIIGMFQHTLYLAHATGRFAVHAALLGGFGSSEIVFADRHELGEGHCVLVAAQLALKPVLGRQTALQNLLTETSPVYNITFYDKKIIHFNCT